LTTPAVVDDRPTAGSYATPIHLCRSCGKVRV
jgi:hypothetical protein